MKTNGKLKKVFGMILIIIFLAINLLMLFALVYNLVEMNNDPNISSTIFSFIFTITLLSFPLYYGISLWKSGIAELVDIPTPADGTITTSRVQITFNDYRLLYLKLTLKNPIVIYCGFLGLSFLIAALLNPTENALTGIAIGFVFILIPSVSIFQAKRNYNLNKNLREEIVYEFNVDNIIITGKTFKSTQRWSSLFKIKEMNDWILLYTDKIVAICVPKSAFSSESELNAVLSFALNAKGVKRELK
ncbi:MAG: YcxB family protein [Cyclobacteriaceae bacterium]|nr:YcxB family protein [Cyclobacteriaceae bacterium]